MQRVNSALELSLHFHMLVPNGVFVAGGSGVDERPRFVELAMQRRLHDTTSFGAVGVRTCDPVESYPI